MTGGEIVFGYDMCMCMYCYPNNTRMLLLLRPPNFLFWCHAFSFLARHTKRLMGNDIYEYWQGLLGMDSCKSQRSSLTLRTEGEEIVLRPEKKRVKAARRSVRVKCVPGGPGRGSEAGPAKMLQLGR